MKEHVNSEPKQTHHPTYPLMCLSISGNSGQCVMLVPNNLQDLSKSGMKKTNASLNICLCSWLRFFPGYLLFFFFFVNTCVLFVTYKWKTVNPSQMHKGEDSKSSSGVITIHHAIMYLGMSSYARYLTRQTTTIEEIPFTAQIPAALNSVIQ